MDPFRVHLQVVQLVMKMLLAVVATALFLIAQLVLPLIRWAVVALVRFPSVVADRHYDAQRAEVEARLAGDRHTAKAQAALQTVVPVRLAPVTSDSESEITARSEPDGYVPAAMEPPAVLPAAPAPAPDPQPQAASEPTVELDPEDSTEVNEGPVLRYRPKPTSGD